MADEISTEVLEAAAQAVATLVERRHHSQLCPVWVSKAEVQWCTCWILTRARTQATAAAPYLIAEGRRAAQQKIDEATVYIDWLRTSLCRLCEAGFCSAHQPASGFFAAIDKNRAGWAWPVGAEGKVDQ